MRKLLVLLLAYAPWASVLCGCGGGGGGGGGAPGPGSGTTTSAFVAPCHFTSQAYQGYQSGPASQYARTIIGYAASIGGVSMPQGGIYEVPGMENAYYQPQNDSIAYDPNFLTRLNVYTQSQEAGDSVLYHETGHMWSQKIGQQAAIGQGTVEQNWRHEYQADSFAGKVLRQLGGSAQPSVAVYTNVMGSWSASHPPGQNRAQVFVTAFQTNQVTLFARTSEGPGGTDHLARLRVVSDIGAEMHRRGVNPYTAESDRVFLELMSERGISVP